MSGDSPVIMAVFLRSHAGGWERGFSRRQVRTPVSTVNGSVDCGESTPPEIILCFLYAPTREHEYEGGECRVLGLSKNSCIVPGFGESGLLFGVPTREHGKEGGVSGDKPPACQ